MVVFVEGRVRVIGYRFFFPFFRQNKASYTIDPLSSMHCYLELAPVSRLGSLAPRESRVLLDRQGLEITRHCKKVMGERRLTWLFRVRNAEVLSFLFLLESMKENRGGQEGLVEGRRDKGTCKAEVCCRLTVCYSSEVESGLDEKKKKLHG